MSAPKSLKKYNASFGVKIKLYHVLDSIRLNLFASSVIKFNEECHIFSARMFLTNLFLKILVYDMQTPYTVFEVASLNAICQCNTVCGGRRLLY